MTAPAELVALALVLGILGPRWMARCSWPSRAPALGILAWQTLSLSVFSSLVLAGLSLSVPELPMSGGLAAFFHACSAALEVHYSTPGGAALSTAGAVATVVLLTRLVVVLARTGHRTRKDRAHQDDLLRMVCTSHPEPDVVVVAHDVPAVYCLPGRSRQVVVTQGALSALSPEQLRQVLAHERAHLRARHHIALLAADAFAGALMNRLGTRQARSQIAELAEMHADDAAEPGGRRDLARAVVLLAGGSHPVGALGATGGSAVLRVRRLAEPRRPVTRLGRLMGLGLGLATALLPLVLVVAPGVSVVASHYCPLF